MGNQLHTISGEEASANDLEMGISNNFGNGGVGAIFRNNRRLTQQNRRYGTLKWEGAKISP